MKTAIMKISLQIITEDLPLMAGVVPNSSDAMIKGWLTTTMEKEIWEDSGERFRKEALRGPVN